MWTSAEYTEIRKKEAQMKLDKINETVKSLIAEQFVDRTAQMDYQERMNEKYASLAPELRIAWSHDIVEMKLMWWENRINKRLKELQKLEAEAQPLYDVIYS